MFRFIPVTGAKQKLGEEKLLENAKVTDESGITEQDPWFPHFLTYKFPVYFSSTFSIFQHFLVFYFMNLTNTQNYFNKILINLIKIRKKSKILLKFPHFSYIMGKMFSFF